MDQVGQILKVEDGMAYVKVRRVGGCGDSCGSCSASCDVPPEYINIIDTLGVAPGEFVEIGTDNSRVLGYMMVLYGVPLLGLLLGSVIGFTVLGSELKGIISGAVGLVVAMIIVKLFDKKTAVRSEDINYMVKKL